MKTITKIASAGVLLAAMGSASAATVTCPGALGDDGNGITVTRQVEVTGALAGGECYYKLGNFQGDDVSDYLGSSYTMIDKNSANGILTGSAGGAESGDWIINSNQWLSYGELFLGFHFGNGSGDPDSFLVELNPGTLSGTWALIPSALANGLSNFYLFGRGESTSSSSSSGEPSTSSSSGTNVPEPASSLVLLGLGLLGLGFMRRRAHSA